MRDRNIIFCRPNFDEDAAESIEVSRHGNIETELGIQLYGRDPRRVPTRYMSPEGFLVWLCVRHTNIERNIFLETWVTHLQKAENQRLTLFFKTAEPPALRIDIRMGQISLGNLKLLRRQARARKLEIDVIEDVRTKTRGAALYLGAELVGVLAARDEIVLER